MVNRYIFAVALGLAVLPASRASSHLIWSEDKHFSVAELSVAVGDTVVFSNEDNVIHNFFSSSGANRFNLRPLQPGTQSAVIFSKPGPVLIRCALHPTMKMNLQVE